MDRHQLRVLLKNKLMKNIKDKAMRLQIDIASHDDETGKLRFYLSEDKEQHARLLQNCGDLGKEFKIEQGFVYAT